MNGLEEHQMYCENENCECNQEPRKGECLRDRLPSGKDDFCSDYCAAKYAEERGIPYLEETQPDA